MFYKNSRFAFILFLSATLFSSLVFVYAWEIDETVRVTQIVDGDSFKVTNDEVRLADVSAPEYYQAGGSQATQALNELIDGKLVYLDTDQKTGRGPYDRLIAVVYVTYNSTHYLNVNKALLEQGVVEETDYTNNEFDPSTWTLHVRKVGKSSSFLDRVSSRVGEPIRFVLASAIIFWLYSWSNEEFKKDGFLNRMGYSRYSVLLVFLLGLQVFVSLDEFVYFFVFLPVFLSLILIVLKRIEGSILLMILMSLEVLLSFALRIVSVMILWRLFTFYLAYKEYQYRKIGSKSPSI